MSAQIACKLPGGEAGLVGSRGGEEGPVTQVQQGRSREEPRLSLDVAAGDHGDSRIPQEGAQKLMR